MLPRVIILVGVVALAAFLLFAYISTGRQVKLASARLSVFKEFQVDIKGLDLGEPQSTKAVKTTK